MRALLVGSAEHPEFAAARRWFHKHLELTTVPGVELALEQLRSGDDPRFILLVQSRRDEISQFQIERLHRAAPLARLLGLLGSWCEGEVRSGRPWAGVKRVYWHQWTPQLVTSDIEGPSRPASTWALPRTATSAERLLRSRQVDRAPRGGMIGISALSFTDFDTLADVCKVAGFSARWLKDPRTVQLGDREAILCDGGTSHRHDLHRIEELIRQFPGVPLVAILGYPRLEDQQRALAAGACGIISKPYLVGDLLDELDRAVCSSQTLPARSA